MTSMTGSVRRPVDRLTCKFDPQESGRVWMNQTFDVIFVRSQVKINNNDTIYLLQNDTCNKAMNIVIEHIRDRTQRKCKRIA